MSTVRETERPYAVILAAWTAMAEGRTGDGAPLRSRLERLCALGVDVAVLGDGDVRAVDTRLRARPGSEGRLFYVLASGAEAYSVGPSGPRLVERRHPGEREERQLQAAADSVRLMLAERGLHVVGVPSPPGRRVLDLMPGRRGRASLVGRSRQAVDERLRAAGFHGLADTVRLARQAARSSGLARAVVSTDGRRLTIGLTGAADAARWVAHNLVAQRGRSAEDVLLVGREFGPRAGLQGADARLLVPDLADATVVSVGEEREGAPPRVVRVGGGAASALSLLDTQIKLRERVAHESFPQLTEDPDWLFRVEGFDPFREREVETWLTVANGASGTRGSLEEGSAASTPTTFVAGVFGDGTAEPRVRAPVPAPDWLCLRLRVDGGLLTLSNGEIVEHRRTLDMRQGLVLREWRQRDRSGRMVRVRTARFASLDERAVMAERAEAVLEEAPGQLVWEGCLGISHAGGAVTEAAVEPLDAPGFLALTRGRNGGGHGLAAITTPAPGSPVVRRVLQSRDMIGGHVVPGEPATVDRLAAVLSARTRPPSVTTVRAAIARARDAGFDELLRRHRQAWGRLWDACDVAIQGDAEAQTAIRFAIYHMISSADPDNSRVSIGARGLSGMSYYCHVFWDTEVFVVPFFIYAWPEAARTLLTYRYRMLPGALEKARMMGHKGALFPWESADTGGETTPPYGFGPGGEKVPILSGFMEHHISADVAWAVWEYWMVTSDDDFMATMGTELMAQTARFWASRAAYERDGSHHIRLVVGPDEYHESVDDNAFTNVLARWNIRHALEALSWLGDHDPEAARRLRARMELSDDEIENWAAVADLLVDGFDPATGLYEQFEGFFQLEDLDPALLHPKPLPADLLLGREVTGRSKVIKQADVVMLCHMIPDEIEIGVARRNYEYYEPITVHGSSLSPATHAAVAAQVGLAEQAMEAFRLACAVDLADNMGNAARGLHLATMGGIWQAVVMGFAGVRRHGTALAVQPRLPEGWGRLAFPLRFRGATLRLTLEPDYVGVKVEDAPLHLLLDGWRFALDPGEHVFVRRPRGDWRPLGGSHE